MKQACLIGVSITFHNKTIHITMSILSMLLLLILISSMNVQYSYAHRVIAENSGAVLPSDYLTTVQMFPQGSKQHQSSLVVPVNVSQNQNTENKNPKIAIGQNGNIYIVWEDFSEDQILFSRSTDGGATFSSPITLNTEGRGNEPQIAVGAENDNVYVIWEKRYNMIAFTRSTDGGATFSNETVWGNDSSYNVISKAK